MDIVKSRPRSEATRAEKRGPGPATQDMKKELFEVLLIKTEKKRKKMFSFKHTTYKT